MIDKVFRYGLSAVANFAFVSLASVFFVEWVGLLPVYAYPIVLALAYILKYILNLKFVFKKAGNPQNLYRFIVYVIFFWLQN